MDPDFVEAWVNVLGSGLCMALSGDKGLANSRIEIANFRIAEARRQDGNEGLTVNDITPDWLRVRGWADPGMVTGPWNGFDWGQLWPAF